jgi:hypothetical protein
MFDDPREVHPSLDNRSYNVDWKHEMCADRDRKFVGNSVFGCGRRLQTAIILLNMCVYMYCVYKLLLFF